ncbi:helix-turn-helix domain-containing protein [Gemmiger formicilis]|uniref:winged helix-turn-helix domain-containing protein n=1 Tax=Gemmiger formicilis TaxID=745368 RepID=UPI00399B2CD4
MLYCMASSPGQVFSKAQLYEAAWERNIFTDKHRGEYHLAAEKKLEEDPRHPAYIKTVVGTGYRLDYPH